MDAPGASPHGADLDLRLLNQKARARRWAVAAGGAGAG